MDSDWLSRTPLQPFEDEAGTPIILISKVNIEREGGFTFFDDWLCEGERHVLDIYNITSVLYQVKTTWLEKNSNEADTINIARIKKYLNHCSYNFLIRQGLCPRGSSAQYFIFNMTFHDSCSISRSCYMILLVVCRWDMRIQNSQDDDQRVFWASFTLFGCWITEREPMNYLSTLRGVKIIDRPKYMYICMYAHMIVCVGTPVCSWNTPRCTVTDLHTYASVVTYTSLFIHFFLQHLIVQHNMFAYLNHYYLFFTNLGFCAHDWVELIYPDFSWLMGCNWRFDCFYSAWHRRHPIDPGKKRSFPRLRRVRIMTWSLILELQGQLLCFLWFRSSGLLVEGHPNGLFYRWFSWPSAFIVGLLAYGAILVCPRILLLPSSL
jgi:hypothetical protein